MFHISETRILFFDIVIYVYSNGKRIFIKGCLKIQKFVKNGKKIKTVPYKSKVSHL